MILMPEQTPQIGFIGLGKMGRPMVANLSRSSAWTVLAHDSDATAVASLHQHPSWGTRLFAASALGNFARCRTVITMLPDSKVTNAVLTGDDKATGLSDVLSPGSIILDMGSSDPAETARLAAKLAAKDIRLIDAPVSGSVVRAETGELTIMVGSLENEAEAVRDTLRWMGKIIIHTGGVASAHAMKALNNYVYAAGLVAVSEALLMARELKLDEAIFAEILNVSSGRNFCTENKLRQFMLPRTYDGGYALRLLSKDLATADTLRARCGVEAAQLRSCGALAREAMDALPQEADSTEIYRFLEQLHERKTPE